MGAAVFAGAAYWDKAASGTRTQGLFRLNRVRRHPQLIGGVVCLHRQVVCDGEFGHGIGRVEIEPGYGSLTLFGKRRSWATDTTPVAIPLVAEMDAA